MSKDGISRKEMKGPDRFQRGAAGAAAWITAHRRRVVAAGAAVLAVLVIGIVVVTLAQRKQQQAGSAAADLLEAMGGEISSVPLPGLPGPFYPSEEARQKAIVEAADSILGRFPGTGAAVLAALAKGDARLRLREWDEARKAYETFLQIAPKEDSLRFGALEGLAIAAEEKGDLEGAGKAWERLGREAPRFADQADLARARLLAAAGKAAEAKEILSAFGEKHAGSLLAPVANERLARLGGK